MPGIVFELICRSHSKQVVAEEEPLGGVEQAATTSPIHNGTGVVT